MKYLMISLLVVAFAEVNSVDPDTEDETCFGFLPSIGRVVRRLKCDKEAVGKLPTELTSPKTVISNEDSSRDEEFKKTLITEKLVDREGNSPIPKSIYDKAAPIRFLGLHGTIPVDEPSLQYLFSFGEECHYLTEIPLYARGYGLILCKKCCASKYYKQYISTRTSCECNTVLDLSVHNPFDVEDGKYAPSTSHISAMDEDQEKYTESSFRNVKIEKKEASEGPSDKSDDTREEGESQTSKLGI